jgi:ubiquinone/menaquinone biosynthesis C-methylase UbiE
MHPWILPVPDYYARMNEYILQVGLPYSLVDIKAWDEERRILRAAMGDANGQSVLDCACGWGRQTIALAKLGWAVTASDVSATSMDFARRFAAEERIDIHFQECDMRELGRHPGSGHSAFDWAVSCFALYELQTDAEIRQALEGIWATLKPGGQLYLRLRDMDFFMEELPRHRFVGERRIPNGRIVCIEDWEYESETHVIALHAFLREDETRDPADHFRWTTETIGYRKRVLRKAELGRLLQAVGFEPVVFLPQSAPWMPCEVVARRPAAI